MVRVSRQRRALVPEPVHDARQLQAAMLSVKQSFKFLDASSVKLDKQLSRQRTRLHRHLTGAAVADAGRVRSSETAKQLHMAWRTSRHRLRCGASCSSSSSSSRASFSELDEALPEGQAPSDPLGDDWAATLAVWSLRGAPQRLERSHLQSDQSCGSRPPSAGRGRASVSTGSRPHSVCGSSVGAPISPSPTVGAALSASGLARLEQLAEEPTGVRSEQRPNTAQRVTVNVLTSRPFSAPRTRWKREAEELATSTAHRPASAAGRRLPGGSRLPLFANMERPGSRPSSAMRERPPVVPLCEPQARCMSLAH